MGTIIRRTDDHVHADNVLKALRENDGYCPCAIVKTEDTKCLCGDFTRMTEGTCRCKLFIKEIIPDD